MQEKLKKESIEKIKVCFNLSEVNEFLQDHQNQKVCLYIADKTEQAWDISTSRVYMNQISNSFAYLPLNIKKDDFETIKKTYELAENNNQIVAINQTQPHKSNPVLKQWFASSDIPENVDSLIKTKEQKLICYNLNGPAFTGWFEDEVCAFKNKTVVVFGVGGVGEPIAREIAIKGAKKIYLIDINSKEKLAEELSKSVDTYYYEKLSQINFDSEEFILINCAGKEGADDNNIKNIIERFKNLNNIFVDLRPQLNIDIVNIAKSFGWDAYTGFGMNSRNDYALLEKINETINIHIPTFKEFARLVELSS